MLEEISLRYSGHIAEWKTELIRNGAIKGILNQMLDEKANLVNAATIASSRGLRSRPGRVVAARARPARVARTARRRRPGLRPALIARSLSSFSAVAVSVLLLLQPALAAIWGVAFLDETLIAIQIAGIAIVLFGVTIARPRADRPSGAA